MIHQYRPTFSWRELWAVLHLGAGRKEFEKALAAKAGSRYGLTFAYGRSALVALLRVSNIHGADVILPAYTCHVMAEAIVESGNNPVFVDIDLADFNMDLRALKTVLTRRTRAIIATHMHGYRADIAAIRNIVGDQNIAIVEDAALSGPTRDDGERPGGKGDVTIFSFSPGKHLYAVQGGVLVTDSAERYEKLKDLRDREMNRLPRSVWLKRLARLMTGYLMLNAPFFEAWNQVNQRGLVKRVRNTLGITPTDMPPDYATSLADFQARVGLVQLGKFNAIVAKHQAWAQLYDQELGTLAGLTRPALIPGATYAHYAARVAHRDEIGFGRRMRARGIEIGTAFRYVVPHLPAYRRYARGSYSCAEQAASEIVNLPNYATLSSSHIRYIAESTRRVLEQGANPR